MEKKLNQAGKGGKNKLNLAIQRLKQGCTVNEWALVDNVITSNIKSVIDGRLEFKPEFTDANFLIILKRLGFNYTDNRTTDSTIVFTQRIIKKKLAFGRHVLLLDKKKCTPRDCFTSIIALLDCGNFNKNTTFFIDIEQFAYNLDYFYKNTNLSTSSKIFNMDYVFQFPEKI